MLWEGSQVLPHGYGDKPIPQHGLRPPVPKRPSASSQPHASSRAFPQSKGFNLQVTFQQEYSLGEEENMAPRSLLPTLSRT